MDKAILSVKSRDVTGGGAVKRLRLDGMVPGVIHDHGKASVVIMAPYLHMMKAYQRVGKSQPITLKTDKKQYTALIKHVTFDPRKNTLSHIVFNAVKANEKVDASVPVRVKLAEGDEQTLAEQKGLVVLHQLDEVEVEAFPRDLPEEVFVDGTKLIDAGDHLTVADIVAPQNVTIKTEATHPVVTVFEPSALQSAEAESEGDESVDETHEASDETKAEASGAAESSSADKKE